MKIIQKTAIIFTIPLFIMSCIKTKDNTPPDHSIFFPVDENLVQKFYVKSITIDKPMNRYDTVEYYLTFLPDSIYFDSDVLTGEYTVFKGKDFSTVGTPENRLVRELTFPVGLYIENIDNCRKVKCRLPIIEESYWNTDIYCNGSDTVVNSVVKNIKHNFKFKGREFDSIVHIVNLYDSSLINLDIIQEIWAARYGLIYREISHILSDDSNLDFTLPIRQRIERGTVIEMIQVFE